MFSHPTVRRRRKADVAPVKKKAAPKKKKAPAKKKAAKKK